MSATVQPSWCGSPPHYQSDDINPALATSPWSGHRHFAYDLVRFAKPDRIVELGTHFGCSFFAFLQAVKDNGLGTECVAVDTWTGDEHAGQYGPEVLQSVEQIVSAHFHRQNVQLLQSTFDDALLTIDDESVDILHIDGYHGYEQVTHDYRTWLPKLRADGLVLFHDVDPKSNYGSARFWSEVREGQPCLEFLDHSWGLGVLFPKGADLYNRLAAERPNWLGYYREEARASLAEAQYQAAAHQLEERWKIIEEMDAALTSSKRAATEAAGQATGLARSAAKRSDVIARLLGSATRPRDIFKALNTQPADLFPELAFTLYCFTRVLWERLVAEGYTDALFVSREGQRLADLFNDFVDANGPKERLRGHYVRVSRKSTLLPSLGPLAAETFDTLFRQYRRMSALDFMRSLALESFSDPVAASLRLPPSALAQTMDDFPTSEIFAALKADPVFSARYEETRLSAQKALATYLDGVTGAAARTAIVDVGWKGTIQDNLWNFYAQIGRPRDIDGYYIGLVAPGNASQSNRKSGLVFSNLPKRSDGFTAFDEFRSLFELMLPADHGSAKSHVLGTDGSNSVVVDDYHEQEFVEQNITPWADRILDLAKALTECVPLLEFPTADLLQDARDLHARMTFSPTPSEVSWAVAAKLPENFGVFHDSGIAPVVRTSALSRMSFGWRLATRPRAVDLGFWPIVKIRQLGPPGLDVAYSWYRCRRMNMR